MEPGVADEYEWWIWDVCKFVFDSIDFRLSTRLILNAQTSCSPNWESRVGFCISRLTHDLRLVLICDLHLYGGDIKRYSWSHHTLCCVSFRELFHN